MQEEGEGLSAAIIHLKPRSTTAVVELVGATERTADAWKGWDCYMWPSKSTNRVSWFDVEMQDILKDMNQATDRLAVDSNPALGDVVMAFQATRDKEALLQVLSTSQ